MREYSEASLPPQDTKAFLDRAASPGSSEHSALRSRIVGAVEHTIQTKLTSTDSPVIGFSDRIRTDPSILTPLEQRGDKNARYKLKDPEKLWSTIEEQPDELQVDCLNIVPITIVGSTRDVLIERGHAAEAIDDSLRGSVFHGAKTHISSVESGIEPWNTDTDSESPSYSQKREGNLLFTRSRNGIEPGSVVIPFGVAAGDIYASVSRGVRHLDNYGNADAQNAIILEDAPRGGRGTMIPVFAHTDRPADRDTDIEDIMHWLVNGAHKRGMSVDEYMRHGGIGADIIDFDYAGFYTALAKNV